MTGLAVNSWNEMRLRPRQSESEASSGPGAARILRRPFAKSPALRGCTTKISGFDCLIIGE
jgi:hypothetical protein